MIAYYNAPYIYGIVDLIEMQNVVLVRPVLSNDQNDDEQCAWIKSFVHEKDDSVVSDLIKGERMKCAFQVKVSIDSKEETEPGEDQEPTTVKFEKIYCFSVDNEALLDKWVSVLNFASENARLRHQRMQGFVRIQTAIRKLYNSAPFQAAAVLAILLNFAVSLAQVQVGVQQKVCLANALNLTRTTPYQPPISDGNWNTIELIFTYFFLGELLIHFTSYAFVPFFKDTWNLLDASIVLVSVILLHAEPNGSGGASNANEAVRIVRVVRIFRVLRRVGQLRQIVVSIARALAPGIQALLVMLVVGAFYAYLGVRSFGDQDPAEFCDFYHSFFTMFSIIAFNNAPHLDFFDQHQQGKPDVVFFVWTFIFIVMYILLQVVIAMLLESFELARTASKEE
eukprot:CAMPEP_0113691486 /NCGR_PEP_ID=MMETSP0038_2-20120614/18463_1 /TAXON_ID=2898 /ORGANISM="Cryptomonas paramecium" /LENGTH=394 /DNA_ID=CAMNT_0000613107 /DNA_START=645 /DNA_END=1826 /DNA_ORIENTATION=- /assembly_acc=CAM_ASM_000170